MYSCFMSHVMICLGFFDYAESSTSISLAKKENTTMALAYSTTVVMMDGLFLAH